MSLAAQSRAATQLGFDLTGWGVDDLWIAALAIGGSFERSDVDDIAAGRKSASPMEHDVLAAAFNDHLPDIGVDHPIPTWRQLGAHNP